MACVQTWNVNMAFGVHQKFKTRDLETYCSSHSCARASNPRCFTSLDRLYKLTSNCNPVYVDNAGTLEILLNFVQHRAKF